MQTNLSQWAKNSPAATEAEAILRKCVHCGFCSATCPTYQINSNENDSPRGRIYLIKEMLEGQQATESTRQHLDLCLTCHNCESTCPSGVKYGHLLDIGREILDEKLPRTSSERFRRRTLARLLNSPLLKSAVRLGRMVKPVLPKALQEKLPDIRPIGNLPSQMHEHKVLMPLGCVQPALAPSIDGATIRVLDAVGISCVQSATNRCCGAVNFHLDEFDRARAQMKANVDEWAALLESGKVQAIVLNASACSATIKEYPHHLAHEGQVYVDKANYVLEHVKDVAELLAPHVEQLKAKFKTQPSLDTTFHPPCTLQHWQKLRATNENLLRDLGFGLKPFNESHLCCGSSGTYSMLQPEMSKELRQRKLNNIGQTGQILTANMGCMVHLQGGTTQPVRHWIEAVDACLS